MVKSDDSRGINFNRPEGGAVMKSDPITTAAERAPMVSLECFTSTWFPTLQEAVAHARKFPRSYVRSDPARVGWVEDNEVPGGVRWHFVPRGSSAPEGFVHSLFFPEEGAQS